LNGGMIELEGYSRIHGNKPIPEKYLLSNEKVIIIEGVIGLALPYLREIADLKIFKDIDEEIHYARIHTFHTWKGFNQEQIITRLNERKIPEYDFINSTKIFADLIV
jgi:uridine kinase